MCGHGHFVWLASYITSQADSIGPDEAVGRESIFLWYHCDGHPIFDSGFSSEENNFGDPNQSQPLISGSGHSMASLAKYVETLSVAFKPGFLVNHGLPHGVNKTIPNARAPSTWRLYALKWKLFVSWCRNQILLFPISCAGWDVKTFLSHLCSFLWVICGPERPPFEPLESGP